MAEFENYKSPKVNAILNDSPLDVVRGLTENQKGVEKFGRNRDMASGVSEIIWDGSTATYEYMTSGSTLYASSSNDTDVAVFEIEGLDENWDLQTLTVQLDGFNFVVVPGLWIRVFRVKNIDSVETLGDVYISNNNVGVSGVPTDPLDIKAKVLISINQTNMAIYTIPAGYTGYLRKFYSSLLRASGVADIAADTDIYIREENGVFRSTLPIGLQGKGNGSFIYEWIFPIPITEKSDIQVRGSATATADITSGFSLLLIKNT